ncbi:MurR/RpiR family transcriptional regulator [Marinomonas sp. C2222]|uniref:MurR/RpiR family transcriptional regulator n=1 Tax=Marinomonas sargassi TaxID=2984494 RepID=A0ABT2YPM2_9GAMM|nr:MurR/RpiR family transcriptional regulator [Marinomonas sargassi]MCV2401845.1 MurR/RpiR family transcriptional regulator [Marinomonas sargassi]
MTIKDRIEEMFSQLTATEQRLGTAILADYPFAGLQPINELAEKTKVSPPTISRFVAKLGCAGLQEFQQLLISELKESQRSPVDLKRTSAPVEGAYLAGFMARVEGLVKQTTESITEAQFERTCNLLADTSHRLFIIGGRMSDAIAVYAFKHFRQIRTKVYHIPADPEEWPEYLLQMQPKDVLLVINFRRYQDNLSDLAEQARKQRSANIILMTDPWLSPVAQWSKEVLTLPINSNTVWDCYAPAFGVMEAILTYVAELDWDRTKNRIEAWDVSRSQIGKNRNTSK